MQKNITDHVNTQDVLATARWGEPDYMAHHYPYKEGSFWLGRNPHNPHQALGYEGEGHIFLAAGARSGKGRSIIINNLIKWPGSLVSIDPKGMNATITAVRRGQGNPHCDGMGQDVYVLDPMNYGRTSTYWTRLTLIVETYPHKPILLQMPFVLYPKAGMPQNGQRKAANLFLLSSSG